MESTSERNYYTPAEVTDLVIQSGITKAKLPLLKMLLLACMAGCFIAAGAMAANVVAQDISSAGIARLLAGVVFPMGLIAIVVVSGELFCGNCLMVEAFLSHQIGFVPLLRNWVIVFIGNLLGSLIVVACVYLSGQFDLSGGQLGAYTIKVAVDKTNLSFGAAFVSGTMCNLLICVAVLSAEAAKDIGGKIAGVFFPSFAFIVCGFEFCVANMYYIPAGMLAAMNPTYAQAAASIFGITSTQLASLNLAGFLSNLLPVTLGNIVGATAIGVALFIIYKSKICNPKR